MGRPRSNASDRTERHGLPLCRAGNLATSGVPMLHLPHGRGQRTRHAEEHGGPSSPEPGGTSPPRPKLPCRPSRQASRRPVPTSSIPAGRRASATLLTRRPRSRAPRSCSGDDRKRPDASAHRASVLSRIGKDRVISADSDDDSSPSGHAAGPAARLRACQRSEGLTVGTMRRIHGKDTETQASTPSRSNPAPDPATRPVQEDRPRRPGSRPPSRDGTHEKTRWPWASGSRCR